MEKHKFFKLSKIARSNNKLLKDSTTDIEVNKKLSNGKLNIYGNVNSIMINYKYFYIDREDLDFRKLLLEELTIFKNEIIFPLESIELHRNVKYSKMLKI